MLLSTHLKIVFRVLESVDGSKHYDMPPIIECHAIPNNTY